MSDLAAALDVVGARWALLVVERLLEGPQRYGDLQRDLGAPTNILATRLRDSSRAAARAGSLMGGTTSSSSVNCAVGIWWTSGRTHG